MADCNCKQTCKWDAVFEMTETDEPKFSQDGETDIRMSSDDSDWAAKYDDKSEWKVQFATPDTITLTLGTQVVVDGRIKYVLKFTQGAWQETGRLARYYLEIPMSHHGLGFTASVEQVERDMGNTYENVWYSYERYANGIIVLYADEKYSGRVIIGGST